MKMALVLAALFVASSSVYAADSAAPARQVGDACTMGDVTGHLVQFGPWLICVAPPDTNGGGTGG